MDDNAKQPTTPTPEQPAPAQPLTVKKKKKTGLIIGIVSAVVLVLLGTGTVLGYTLWYQNPQKVLADAVTHAVKAKTSTYTGEFAVKASESDNGIKEMTIKVDGKNTVTTGQLAVDVAFTDAEDTKHEFSGEGLYDKDGNLFFKIDNLKDLVAKYSEQYGSELPESFQTIVSKVDGNWIRVSADDLKSLSEEVAEQQTCTRDALKKLESDQAATDELAKLYRDNQFVTVAKDLGVRDGNIGYELGIDTGKAKSFAEGVEQTTYFKELKKCNDDLEIDEDDFTQPRSSDTTYRTEVWISQFSHELREVRFFVEDDEARGELWVKPVFNAPVTVESPKDFIPLRELQADIERAAGEFQTTTTDDEFDSSRLDEDVDYSEFQEN